MKPTIMKLLEPYQCKSPQDYTMALQEVLQECMLLGFARGGLFQKVAFYGGAALRIFHDLDRFSEDMDFTLVEPDHQFDIENYLRPLKREINSLGFGVSVEKKNKTQVSAVQSAFVKANTLEHLIRLTPLSPPISGIAPNQNIRINLEVDIHPPSGARTEILYRFSPQPFPVRLYDLASLFAGKLHALLFRGWGGRVKGRDFYDYLWYIARGIQPNWEHLEARMRQSGHYHETKALGTGQLQELLLKRFDSVDWQQARQDIAPFIRDPRALEFWSPALFRQTVHHIERR